MSEKDFDYASLSPYMQKEFVEARARKEAKEVFDDQGNYYLYDCKYGEYMFHLTIQRMGNGSGVIAENSQMKR